MTPDLSAVETRPDGAEAVFGDRLALAERFAGHLSTTAVEWGLVGPRELPRLWTRHLLNCAVVGELIPAGSRVIDIGSGAGLPGLALAVAREDLEVTLVEPLERRVAWLERVVDDLEVAVTVRRARAEELVGDIAAPVVTARAVASLSKLAGWGLPLVSPAGQLLALKGRSAQEELEACVPALTRWGVTEWDVVRCGSAWLDVPTTVVRVRVGEAGGGRTAGPPSRPRRARRGKR